MTAVRSVMMYNRGMQIEDVSQGVVYDLRTGLYGHMQELSYAFYDTHHIGEIMSRMTGDIEGVRMLIVNGVVGVIENFLMFTLSLAGMSLMSWQLTLIMVCFCPCVAVVALAAAPPYPPGAYRRARAKRGFEHPHAGKYRRRAPGEGIRAGRLRKTSL